MTEWLMRIQTDTIVVQELVEEINCYPYRTEDIAFFAELYVLCVDDANPFRK